MRWVALMALWVAACAAALAQTEKGPSTKPRLRIETGMHIATIGDIAVDGKGRLLATAAVDGTVRLWDLNDNGSLLKTLRVPLGEGFEGQLYAVTLSADGKTLFCAGWTGREWSADKRCCIYRFDTRSGQLTGRTTGFPDTILTLALSPDGKYLAMGLADGFGIGLLRTSDGALVAHDAAYSDANVPSVVWDSAGHLASSSTDGHIRLYNTSLKKLADKKLPITGDQLAFSPDDMKLAVASQQDAHVVVLAATDLHELYKPATDDIKEDPTTNTLGRLRLMAWSPDGKYLYGSGAFYHDGKGFIRRWEKGGQGQGADISIGKNGILRLRVLPDGKVLYAAAGPSWGVLSTRGEKLIERTAPRAEIPIAQGPLRLSNDGQQVRFPYDQAGETPALFDLKKRSLTVRTAETSRYFDLSDFTKEPSRDLEGVNADAMKVGEAETVVCLTVGADKQRVLVGSTVFLRCFGKDGKVLWAIPVPDPVIAVSIAGNGKIGAALYGDGTIRFYQMTNGYNTVGLFPHADRKRWAMWTRSGYYDCSPGGEELLGWHLNQGEAKAAQFYPISQFRETFYRPDVIDTAMVSATEAAAVAQANAERKIKPVVVVPVEQQLPPIISILSPDSGDAVSTETVTLRYRTESPGDAPVTGVRALVDGVGTGKKDLVRVSEGSTDEKTLTVTLPPHDCTISLLAQNKNGTSTPATIRLIWKGKPAGAPNAPDAPFLIKPKLYVLAIGVGKFSKSTIPVLDFPAKDANDFVRTLKAQSGGLYRAVEAKLLTNEQADRDGIADGLEWLQKQTTSKDVAMLFLSGHGTNDTGGSYHFVPYNFDPEKFKRTGITFADIKFTLEQTAGKVVFFVDSCHSGNVLGQKTRGDVVDITGIVNELTSAENGVVVFTASTGRQVALEDPAWGNGAFTKAVIEGLAGQADFNKTGRITINMLDLYISERVKELTGGKQTPTTTKPTTVPDFPIALK